MPYGEHEARGTRHEARGTRHEAVGMGGKGERNKKAATGAACYTLHTFLPALPQREGHKIFRGRADATPVP
jgi:hypothetical protein